MEWLIAAVSLLLGGGGALAWVRFFHTASVDKSQKLLTIEETIIERLQERLDAVERDNHGLHQELREMRSKMKRWELRFRELGVEPPNGNHSDIEGVPI